MLTLDGVEISLGANDKRRLRFSWAALIALHDLWGEEFEPKVVDAIQRDRLREIATLIIATTTPADQLPTLPYEWEAEIAKIIAMSPPIRDTCMRIEIAWAYAYNGFEAATRFAEVRKREEEAQKKAAGVPAKKWIRSLFTSAYGMLTRTRSEAV